MKKLALLAVVLAASLAVPAFADVVGPGRKVIDCFCTDQTGERVELGQSICLNVDGRHFTARCEMSLNVPMWREQKDGCLTSSLLERLYRAQPSPNSGAVYSKI